MFPYKVKKKNVGMYDVALRAFSRCSLLSGLCLDGFKNVTLQPTAQPELLHARADRSHGVSPGPTLEAAHLDPPTRHMHRDREGGVHRGLSRRATARAALPVLRVRPREVRNELGRLEAHETVVDRVPLEDVAERAREDERNAGRFQRRRRLLARGTRAEVVARDEDDAGLVVVVDYLWRLSFLFL